MLDEPHTNLTENDVSQSVKHGLRTPLNQIIGYGEMLAEEVANSGREDLLPDIEKILQAGRYMVNYVDRMFISLLSDSEREKAVVPAALEFNLSDQISSERREQTQQSGVPEIPLGKILVVDDNEANRDMLSRRLRSRRYSVELAENGNIALEKLAKESFDLVLLDVMMPEMDGYQTLTHIKADKRLKNIPVIMISAQTELDSVVRCIEIGAEDYLPKPFNSILLWARLGSTLEKKRLREQEQDNLEQTLRAEADLERHRTLTQMVAGVAHEINTPLGIASTALSVIQARLFLPKIKALLDQTNETREILTDILDSSTLLKSNILRAHKLVETFKKIAVSQVTEKKEQVNLPDVVTDAVGLFRINARQAKLHIAIDASGISGKAEWLGYPGYLTQVILNFLQNIERYAYSEEQGGKVDVTISDQGQDCEAKFKIEVRDYGAGICPENLPKIFDPFFTTGRGRGGTGLGLSIVNNIVTSALKGNILATSQLNSGTVFTIIIPKTIPD